MENEKKIGINAIIVVLKKFNEILLNIIFK